METKICTKCKENKPKTLEFFLLKPKDKIYPGSKEILRSRCKKCFYNKSVNNRIKARCNELGIEVTEWEEWKRLNMMSKEIFQFKNEKIKHLPRPLRARILKKEREEGYVFTTIEQYYEDCTNNRSKAHRKYDYGSVNVISEKIRYDKMPDYYVANRLKLKLSDCPKEVLETKRLILELKRTIKNPRKNGK